MSYVLLKAIGKMLQIQSPCYKILVLGHYIVQNDQLWFSGLDFLSIQLTWQKRRRMLKTRSQHPEKTQHPQS